jgi:hypothetical protein
VALYLRIGTDPTVWYPQEDYAAVAAALSQAGPVVLDVVHPLQGRLVLSVEHAGSVSLVSPLDPHGIHPTDTPAPAPFLYVPTATGPDPVESRYPLATGTDLGALEQSIMAAMRAGTPLAVQVSSGAHGLVMLGGAALAFAVICPAAP